jgi:hypothetical protein
MTMIELRDDSLRFSFPEVHPGARLAIDLQRTLRIPDDGRDYPLPPGLGSFPLRHVDDFAERIPPPWIRHGGVMLPMYQSEAMWLCFNTHEVDGHWVPYPFAIKIATGKINAVTGDAWSPGLGRKPQDYVVAPEQPWLDGYCVEKGIIRQFVAMPLGAGYSAEEQITGGAEHGGLQIAVFPMKREVFERRFPKTERERMEFAGDIRMSATEAGLDMGLAPGGRMRQEIYDDPFDFEDWYLENSSRSFVHVANSLIWRAITGTTAPTTPPTAKEYTRAGLPWFDYLDERATAVDGSDILKKMKSVLERGREKGDVPLPENEAVTVERVIEIRAKLKEGQVREGVF